MRGASALLFLVLQAALAVSAEKSKSRNAARYVVRVLNIHACPEMAAMVANMNYTVGRNHDGNDVVAAEGFVVRVVNRFSKFKVILNRCREAVTSNTCEYFQTLDWSTGVCQLIPMKKMVWSPFVEAIHPEVKCPLPSGDYYARNISLDVDSFVRTIPVKILGYVWVPYVRLWGETDDDLLLCFRAELSALRYISRHD